MEPHSPKKSYPKRSTSPNEYERSVSPSRSKKTIHPLPEITDEIILNVRNLRDLVNLVKTSRSLKTSVDRLLPEILRRRYHLYRRNTINLQNFIYDLLEVNEIGVVKHV